MDTDTDQANATAQVGTPAPTSNLLTVIENGAETVGQDIASGATTLFNDLQTFLSQNGGAAGAAAIANAQSALVQAGSAMSQVVEPVADSLVATFLKAVPGGSVETPIATALLNTFLTKLGFAPATALPTAA